MMKNVCGPILIGRYTSPMFVLLESSKTLTINSLGFITNPYMVSFDKELFAKMFKDEHVSTRTLDKIVSTHSSEMCSALLWFLPSGGSSPSLKPKLILEAILFTTPLNWKTEISWVTWVVLKNFTSPSLWASEHINKDNLKIFDGFWLSCSSTL